MAPLDAIQLGPSVGSYSPAIKYNGLVFSSGCIGIDLKTMKLIDGTTKDRTIQALKIISAVLQQAGTNLQNVIKVNVYLTSLENYELFNEGFDEVITWDIKPTRTTVVVQALPFGADVEIEVVAAQTS
ncbi:endoribonuclease L-PSP [Ilyonectria sp. MPI-CAGE-AT-0026]|nr:endoribonuclease L-PSP [Ilyonectria sp. MPI-CAGE-AT-0026]